MHFTYDDHHVGLTRAESEELRAEREDEEDWQVVSAEFELEDDEEDCLHVDDLAALLKEEGLDARPDDE